MEDDTVYIPHTVMPVEHQTKDNNNYNMPPESPETMPTTLIVMLCLLFVLHVVCLFACCLCGRARRKPNPAIVSRASRSVPARPAAPTDENFSGRPALDFIGFYGVGDRMFGHRARTIVYLPPATAREPENVSPATLQRNMIDPPPPYDYDPPPPYPGYDGPIYSIPLRPCSSTSSSSAITQGQRN